MVNCSCTPELVMLQVNVEFLHLTIMLQDVFITQVILCVYLYDLTFVFKFQPIIGLFPAVMCFFLLS